MLSAEVRSILAELVQLPFFRFYKVALYRGCPFWPSDGACHKKQCAVALCEEKDLPTALDLEVGPPVVRVPPPPKKSAVLTFYARRIIVLQEPVVMECGKTPLGDFHDTITASEKQAIDEMQAFSNAQLEYCDTEGSAFLGGGNLVPTAISTTHSITHSCEFVILSGQARPGLRSSM